MRAIPRILQTCKELLNNECAKQADQNAPNQVDCWSCTTTNIAPSDGAAAEEVPQWDGFLIAVNIQTSIQ